MYIVKLNKDGKWSVIKDGNKRASKLFDSKIEAISYASKKAEAEGTSFRVEEKSHPATNKKFILILFLIVLLVVIIIGILIGLGKIKLPINNEDSDHTDTVIQEGELSIHFLELGNQYAGDSVFIKAGDVDILIDAGSRESSSTTIHNYIKNYCTDGKLEYVIATHAHQDHIAGFVGTKSNPGIFDLYECEVIIDYALRNTTSSIAQSYEAKRDTEVSLGAKHYTAKDCIDKTNGASNSFKLTDTITMEILDQKYYHEKGSDENDYSVCMLLSYGDNHFLFTGDLEEKGEASLVEKNTLPHCKVFKGGHHGSKTSSTEKLLSKITPEVVCVCCCAGSSEYTNDVDNMFPTQDFINRVAIYTNRIYVTTLAQYTIAEKDGHEYPKVNGFESMNGNIVVTLDKNGNVVATCSNKDIILKQTDWFNSTIVLDGIERKMRTWPEGGK